MEEALKEKLNEAISKLFELNNEFTKCFEILNEQKNILPKEKYSSELNKLFRDYESNYNRLYIEIEKAIFFEKCELESYETVLYKNRITAKNLEEKYQVKLPKWKFDKKKFIFSLYDPKHEPPITKEKQ